jgi:hypothetical protein
VTLWVRDALMFRCAKVEEFKSTLAADIETAS